jgi:hypothetical protein
MCGVTVLACCDLRLEAPERPPTASRRDHKATKGSGQGRVAVGVPRKIVDSRIIKQPASHLQL